MDKYLMTFGKLVIFAGVMIILALVLPSGAWWFIGGIALIIIGVKCCKFCKKR